MRLPDTNSLALADTNDELVIDGSDPPLATPDDARALLPGWARELDSPVRDALLAAWRAMANAFWARLGQTLARLISPRYAAGLWLAWWGRQLKRPQVATESEPEYRARLIAPRPRVTPNAVRAVVDALVAEVTAARAACFEPAADGLFAASDDPAAPWCGFAQPDAGRLLGTGVAFPAGACYASDSDAGVPEFWVVLPGDAGDDSATAYALDLDVPYGPNPVATGAESPTGALAYDFAADAPPLWLDADLRFVAARPDSLADRVIAQVEATRAFGVRWLLFVDPYLPGAV